MLGEQKYLVIGAGVAALAVLYLVKSGNAGEVGAAVGGAAVDLAGGVIAGGAIGIGDAIGVPRTNETECQKALREGRYWDASFACPAGTFLGGAADGITTTISETIDDWL